MSHRAGRDPLAVAATPSRIGTTGARLSCAWQVGQNSRPARRLATLPLRG